MLSKNNDLNKITCFFTLYIYTMSKSSTQLIKDMQELKETEWRKELKKSLNLARDWVISELINIEWVDHDLKYSAHDVNRRSLVFIDYLLDLPDVVISQNDEKETKQDDMDWL